MCYLYRAFNKWCNKYGYITLVKENYNDYYQLCFQGGNYNCEDTPPDTGPYFNPVYSQDDSGSEEPTKKKAKKN